MVTETQSWRVFPSGVSNCTQRLHRANAGDIDPFRLFFKNREFVMHYQLKSCFFFICLLCLSQSKSIAAWNRYEFLPDGLSIRLPEKPIAMPDPNSRTFTLRVAGAWGTYRPFYAVKIIDVNRIQDFQVLKKEHVSLRNESWKDVKILRETPIRCGEHPGIDFTISCHRNRRFNLGFGEREDIRVLQVADRLIFLIHTDMIGRKPRKTYFDGPLDFFDSLRWSKKNNVEAIPFAETAPFSGSWIDTNSDRVKEVIFFRQGDFRLMSNGRQEGTYMVNEEKREIDFAVFSESELKRVAGTNRNSRLYFNLDQHVAKRARLRKGIYELDGPNLKIALGTIKGPRPKNFADANIGEVLLLRRPGKSLVENGN